MELSLMPHVMPYYGVIIYCRIIIIITYYHDNGEIALKGQSKIVEVENDIHWFYFGDWSVYDENGKLIKIKKYENGELISEIEIE